APYSALDQRTTTMATKPRRGTTCLAPWPLPPLSPPGFVSLRKSSEISDTLIEGQQTYPAKSDENRSMHRWSIALFSIATLVAPARAAELSKGFKLLVEHGFQIQGMITKDDVFHLPTYVAANYTTLAWLGESNPSAHG